MMRKNANERANKVMRLSIFHRIPSAYITTLDEFITLWPTLLTFDPGPSDSVYQRAIACFSHRSENKFYINETS